MSAAEFLDRLVWDDPQAVPVVARTAHPPRGGCRLPAVSVDQPTKNSTPRPLVPGRGA